MAGKAKRYAIGADWFVVVRRVGCLKLYLSGSGWTSAGQAASIYRDEQLASSTAGSRGGEVERWPA